jgi:hypothetical protein
MPRDTLLETKESVVTVRSVSVGFMLTAAMVIAIPASSLANTGANTGQCTCAKPAIQASTKIRARKARPARAAVHRPRGQAYAERFYNYWSAAPVSMTGWHGEWRQAPDDWVAPAAYASDAYDGGGYAGEGGYGPPPGYGEEAGLHIDRGGWSGGVGNFDGGGGGGGGMGQAIIAQGGGGLNGPTYNDYNQSFQYNPSHAGPWLNRVPPSSSGSGSK